MPKKGETELKTRRIAAAILSMIMMLSCLTVGALGDGELGMESAAAPLPSYSPIADGTITEGEYGDPVVVTNPSHAGTDGDIITYVNSGVNAVPSEQSAKIYVTNDASYLYVAATLDQAIVNGSGVNNSNGAQFGITLSKYNETHNVHQNSKNKDEFYWVLSRFSGANSTTVNPNYGRISAYVAPNPWKQEAVTVKATFVNNTYVHEMRIPWSAIPGMEEGIATDGKLAVTIKLADGTKTGGKQNYYQVGGTAAGNIWDTHGHDTVLTLDINRGLCNSAVAPMSTSAPMADGILKSGEYGAPVIVTGPEHANADGDDIKFISNGVNVTPKAQTAKLYMTNDENYLYVAATLDHAIANGSTITKGNGAMLGITLSKQDDVTNIYQKKFSWFAVRFTGKSASFANGLMKVNGTEPDGTPQADVMGRFTNNTYTYELRIPWSSIPGMENGIDTDGKLAMTVKLADGTTTSGKSNYYQIGGTAAGNIWDGNGHKSIHSVSINSGYMRDTAAPMPTTTPVADGVLSDGEYGNPVILTSQNYANNAGDVLQFVDGGESAASTAQKAKVYMTNDADYLYVAGTLDHAFVNGSEITKGNGAMLGITLSKYDSATNIYQKKFSWFAVRFEGNSVSFASGLMRVNNGNADGTPLAAVIGKYADNTYTYEMRIPWSSISGMEDGVGTNGKLAMTIKLADGAETAGKSNYYQVGGTAAGNIWDGNGHKSVWTMNINQGGVKNVVEMMPTTAPNADGTLGVGEYGSPVIITSVQHADSDEDDAIRFVNNQVNAISNDQRAKVYMTNDKNYLYVAAVLDHAIANAGGVTNSNGALFAITLSKYNQTHNVYQNADGKDEFFWAISRFNGNTPNPNNGRLVGYAAPVKQDGVVITGKFENNTYVHEMRIPWTAIPGMEQGVDHNETLAITMQLADGTKTSGKQNYYVIGGTACTNLYNSSGHDTVLTMEVLSDFPYVKDTVASFSGAVTVDGHVSIEEWGEPIIVTTPDHCQSTWGSYWSNDPLHVNPRQIAKIYSTNDEQYVYFAATVNESDMCTRDGAMWQKAHFTVSIGRHDEETDMERIVSAKKTFERYALYQLGFDGATPKATARGIKVDGVSISEDDWAISYNTETRTYTYELRIPYTMTTLRYGNDNKMQVSFALSDAKASDDRNANVYNIGGTGASNATATAGKFMHTGQSMVLNLNDNPYAEDRDWKPNVGINPLTGDIHPVAIVAMMVVSGCLAGGLCVRRKKS